MTVSAISLTAIPLGVGGLLLVPVFQDSSTGSTFISVPFDIYASQTNNRGTTTLLGSSDGTRPVIHLGINKGEIWFYWVTMDGGTSFFPVSSIAGTVGIALFVTAAQINVASLSAINADLGTINAGTINSATFNNTAIGAGTGVFLTATSGLAAQIRATSGVALYATANSGTALYGTAGSGGVALFANAVGGLYAVNADADSGVGVNASSDTNYAFYAQHGPYGPFTGAHDALIPKKVKAVAGDVVVDKRIVSHGGISDAISIVDISTVPRMKTVLGVLTIRRPLKKKERPTALSPKDLKRFQRRYQRAIINAVGEGLINVCMDNGPIEAGDLLCTSRTPGKAMKQDDDVVRSYTVGKAREGASKNSQIACIYMCG